VILSALLFHVILFPVHWNTNMEANHADMDVHRVTRDEAQHRVAGGQQQKRSRRNSQPLLSLMDVTMRMYQIAHSLSFEYDKQVNRNGAGSIMSTGQQQQKQTGWRGREERAVTLLVLWYPDNWWNQMT
jgi:hypothetical protein